MQGGFEGLYGVQDDDNDGVKKNRFDKPNDHFAWITPFGAFFTALSTTGPLDYYMQCDVGILGINHTMRIINFPLRTLLRHLTNKLQENTPTFGLSAA